MVLTRKYSPSKYMKMVHKYSVTKSWAIVNYWIYKQPPTDYDKNHNLRFVFVGAMSPLLHKKFEERFKVKARECFGMTEIGLGTMVSLNDDHMTGSGSIGKPFRNRELKIVDEEGHKLKAGETGELLIKGPGMFKGYYKNNVATSEAFDGNWFRSGDIAKFDNNGFYYLAGKKKG